MPVDLQTIMAARLARVDVPRDEPRVRVVIDSIADGLVECGLRIRAGEHLYDPYASDVAHLEGLIERDAEAMRLAERDYEAHRAEVAERGQTERPYRPSLAASFRAMNRRDMLPFRSVRRLEPQKSDKAR